MKMTKKQLKQLRRRFKDQLNERSYMVHKTKGVIVNTPGTPRAVYQAIKRGTQSPFQVKRGVQL